jgi:hypothetical protein
MSDRTQLEARVLSAAELEVVNATRPPAIEQTSDEQLKVLAQRLRQARDRAKDIAARQKREMRGKVDPRGTKPTRDNTGTLAKAQVLAEAIERIEEELSRRENLTTATTTQADLSRRALELKLSHPAPPHPGSGRSASEGMNPKERRKPLRVGASKGEVGRVSEQGKVAQARKDSGDH